MELYRVQRWSSRQGSHVAWEHEWGDQWKIREDLDPLLSLSRPKRLVLLENLEGRLER
jgi:hypothetical protein